MREPLFTETVITEIFSGPPGANQQPDAGYPPPDAPL